MESPIRRREEIIGVEQDGIYDNRSRRNHVLPVVISANIECGGPHNMPQYTNAL